MKIINQSWSFEHEVNGEEILKRIEAAGRTCWKSEDRATDGSAGQFVESIMKKNHASVLEHCSVSVRIITDRGVTHELVRHRIAAYSQESTRYCNYSKDKFGNEITVIMPVEFYGGGPPCRYGAIEHSAVSDAWHSGCEDAERAYFIMIGDGASPQLARSVLPNSLKTEIVMTANMREWRHIFQLRGSNAAHPQMKALARDMLVGFKKAIPVLFDDIGWGLT